MGVLRPQPARGAGVSAGGARRRGRGRPRLADKGGKRKGCAEAMRTRGFVGPVRVAALSKLRPGGGYPAAPELSGPGGAVAEEVLGGHDGGHCHRTLQMGSSRLSGSSHPASSWLSSSTRSPAPAPGTAAGIAAAALIGRLIGSRQALLRQPL
jgi:hypothetical protein